MRTYVAFLIAPLTGALSFYIIAAIHQEYMLSGQFRVIVPEFDLVLGFGLAFAYMQTLILGVPAWLLARHVPDQNLFLAMTVGIIIATFPWYIAVFAIWFPLAMLFDIAVSGAIAGAVWWLIYARGKFTYREQEDSQGD